MDVGAVNNGAFGSGALIARARAIAAGTHLRRRRGAAPPRCGGRKEEEEEEEDGPRTETCDGSANIGLKQYGNVSDCIFGCCAARVSSSCVHIHAC